MWSLERSALDRGAKKGLSEMVTFDKEIKLVVSECYTKEKKRHTDISLFILHNTGLLIF